MVCSENLLHKDWEVRNIEISPDEHSWIVSVITVLILSVSIQAQSPAFPMPSQEDQSVKGIMHAQLPNLSLIDQISMKKII